jgi:hypothetical protein
MIVAAPSKKEARASTSDLCDDIFQQSITNLLMLLDKTRCVREYPRLSFWSVC